MDIILDKKKLNFLFPVHPLTDIQIKRYHQNESRFINVYSRDYLPNKIKNGAYIVNLAEHTDIRTHWVALYLQNNNVTYFDSFGVEHIPKEIRTFMGNKNKKRNIFRIQTYDSIICRYFCIKFIIFILPGKTLTEFTNRWKWDFIVHGFHETPNMYSDLNTVPLSDQQQFRLKKINEMKDYFIAEIKERELMSK